MAIENIEFSVSNTDEGTVFLGDGDDLVRKHGYEIQMEAYEDEIDGSIVYHARQEVADCVAIEATSDDSPEIALDRLVNYLHFRV
jgi:hypothetical protein